MNESSIFFFPGGGHDHDGDNSSLIDASVYSIFDFGWEIFGDPLRQSRQVLNYNGFKQLIISTVNSSILEPAGLRLQPGIVNGNAHIIAGSVSGNEIAANTITANNIRAGTITADLLSANVVLVNTVISSNNFDGTIASNGIITGIGTVGWAITWAGDAVFDSSVIRGAIQASALTVDGNNYWTANGFVLGGANGIYTDSGVVRIGTSVVIEGSVVASSVSTPGVDILSDGTLSANSFTLYGNGAIVTSSGNFAVDASGNLYAQNADIYGDITTSNLSATGGSVAGWVISGSSLRNPSSTTILDPNGNIDIGGSLNASGNVNSGNDMNASGTIAANNEVTAASVVRGQYFIGSGTGTDTGTDVVRRSDGYYLRKASLRELKEDIQSINDALDIVNQLTPRTFKWKARETDPDNIHTTQIKRVHKSFGFIVEEVQAVSDELVNWDIIENNGIQSLSPIMWKTDDFIALAIKGIQELNQRLSAIEQQLGYNS